YAPHGSRFVPSLASAPGGSGSPSRSTFDRGGAAANATPLATNPTPASPRSRRGNGDLLILVPSAIRLQREPQSVSSVRHFGFSTCAPYTLTSRQFPVSSNEPSPTEPQVKVRSLAVIAGFFMSSK